MKLNLLPSSKWMSGYLNVDQNPSYLENIPDTKEFAVAYLHNLKPVIGDNPIEEVRVSTPINIIAPNRMSELMLHWTKILQPNGKFSIRFVDVDKVFAYMLKEDVPNMVLVTKTLLGDKTPFRSVVNMSTAKNMLKLLGIKVDIILENGFVVTMEGTKINEDS